MTLAFSPAPPASRCSCRLRAAIGPPAPAQRRGGHPFRPDEAAFDAIDAFFVEPDGQEGLVIERHCAQHRAPAMIAG